jgi:hypothetical protein
MRSTFNSLPEKRIPNTAPPLSTFWSTDSLKIWIALGDGSVVALNDLITYGPPAKCIGPEGPAGAPCACRNGKDGKDGRDGKDGLPGINAPGIVGPQGRPGVDGKDSIANPERVSQLEEEIRQLKAENKSRSEEIITILELMNERDPIPRWATRQELQRRIDLRERIRRPLK